MGLAQSSKTQTRREAASSRPALQDPAPLCHALRLGTPGRDSLCRHESQRKGALEPYTVALTSCGRFDLLARTLRSLLPKLDGPPAGIFIAEDSGDRGIHDVASQFDSSYSDINVIVNDPPLGQIKSIDRLYSRIGTDWIFHCEDDWEFFCEGFIGKSFSILNEFDLYSMVALRSLSDYGQTVLGPYTATSSGIGYHVADGAIPWNGDSAGLHFNPGLRRMRDYRIVGPYARFGDGASELRVSRVYRDLGYRVACLADPAVRHIGDARHARDPFQPAGFSYRMIRSVRKRLIRLRGKFAKDKSP